MGLLNISIKVPKITKHNAQHNNNENMVVLSEMLTIYTITKLTNPNNK